MEACKAPKNWTAELLRFLTKVIGSKKNLSVRQRRVVDWTPICLDKSFSQSLHPKWVARSNQPPNLRGFWVYFVQLLSTEYSERDELHCKTRWVIETSKPSHPVKVQFYCGQWRRADMWVYLCRLTCEWVNTSRDLPLKPWRLNASMRCYGTDLWNSLFFHHFQFLVGQVHIGI